MGTLLPCFAAILGPGRVVHPTLKSGVLSLIPGLATCQLLAKECARSTG